MHVLVHSQMAEIAHVSVAMQGELDQLLKLLTTKLGLSPKSSEPVQNSDDEFAPVIVQANL